ncbi:MAG: polysaccharide biosynthesis/export family protein, partial [Bacteroidaceae bacterium]|nr:polysaccharide biosynthesis/export family protein [Bacteroidaceae bacterium]
MKYRVILLTAFLFSYIFAGAQSVMTDDQVLKYVVTETQKGTSQQQMAAELIKKGVTTSQLQRVRQKAEKLRKEAESGSKQKAKKGSASSESDILVDAAQSRAEELGLNQDEEVVDGGSQEFLGMTEDEQRQVFGRNIFNSKKLTFQAPANLTTPANYVLGAGDQVMVNVWGTSQQTIEASITSDGYVVVEGVGPIKLAGLTVERAKQVLKNKLGAYYSGCSVDLSLMEARNVQVQ